MWQPRGGEEITQNLEKIEQSLERIAKHLKRNSVGLEQLKIITRGLSRLRDLLMDDSVLDRLVAGNLEYVMANLKSLSVDTTQLGGGRI